MGTAGSTPVATDFIPHKIFSEQSLSVPSEDCFWDGLPSDVLRIIFCKLDIRTLLRLCLVSRKFNSEVANNSIWETLNQNSDLYDTKLVKTFKDSCRISWKQSYVKYLSLWKKVTLPEPIHQLDPVELTTISQAGWYFQTCKLKGTWIHGVTYHEIQLPLQLGEYNIKFQKDPHGLVFFIDCSNPESFQENAIQFQNVLTKLKDTNIPLLVCVNKQDIPSAIGVDEVVHLLQLEKEKRPWMCVGTCPLYNMHGMKKGINWLRTQLHLGNV